MPALRENPALLSAFREGRREALAEVYRMHVSSVDGYVRTLARASGCPDMGQVSAVADLIQEVFIRAFSERARIAYDGVRDYGPYLTTIARNCFVDAVRRRGREVVLGPAELSLILGDAAVHAGPEEGMDPRMLAVLTEYLTTLDDPTRAVYEQRFVKGCSQDEASRELGISRRTLRTAEKRLRDGLRRALARAGMSTAMTGIKTRNISTKNGPLSVGPGSLQ